MSETALYGNTEIRFLNGEGMVKNHHVKLILHWSRLVWKKLKENSWTSSANCTAGSGAVSRVSKSRWEGLWWYCSWWSNMSSVGLHCLVETLVVTLQRLSDYSDLQGPCTCCQFRSQKLEICLLKQE